MSVRLLFVFSILLFILRMNTGYAQTVSTRDFPTQATDTKAGKKAKKEKSIKKQYRYIIKKDSKNTLYGNQCFKEVTQKFGFEYAIECSPLTSNQNGFSRWSHNFGVKFVLFFRNGPFWQLRMKKKYKMCQYQYGDFIG